MEITKILAEHYPIIAAIYLQGIATGNATFQTEAPDWEDWDNSHISHSRIAVIVNKMIAGWAALTPVSNRCVYAGVAEVSVYVGSGYRGKGLGKILLEELIKESEKNNLWTLQSGILPENTASIKLHEQCGFRKIGYREKIGNMNGVWRDNIVMERRSKTVGI
ncbi:MAG: N-acetyltransferase family protein [Chitinophagaceae bacterium]|nr:MAG: N-acetyltransferase family protein [Chitinophagaceae bacterium]